MCLDYESRSTVRTPLEQVVYLHALRCFAAYFVASLLTLLLLDALWLGELPLLALVQLPKTALAGWLRTEVVMYAIRALGLSRGSFSPDYSMARPYALAIAYLIPLGIVLPTVWVRTRMVQPFRRWACILLILAALDFCVTLALANGPALTIY